MKVSACIMTYNEEEHIRGLLDDIKDCVDEIVVVDGRSTDDTVEICAEYTDNLYERQSRGWPEPDRDFCIRQARNKWVLFLDADERPSAQLSACLDMFTNRDAAAYWIPRRNYYAPDRYYRHIFYPDLQLRLFDKTRTKWPNGVHSSAEVDGWKITLREPYYIKHLDPIYSDREKYLRWAKIHADNYPLCQPPVVYHAAAPINYLKTLFVDVARGCVLDGAAGIVAANRHASYNYMVYKLIGDAS
jgi:glycosyltransferase involved in cell wall biosynthesis